MGYDGILFGRLDYQEKDQRTAEKTLQMVWKVNENARKNIQLFNLHLSSFFSGE
jgi:hypothetical protein